MLKIVVSMLQDQRILVILELYHTETSYVNTLQILQVSTFVTYIKLALLIVYKR